MVDGIAEVKVTENGARRVGGILGFQICKRLLTPEEFETVLADRHQKEVEMVFKCSKKEITTHEYWCHRYATVQVEYVWEVMKVAYHYPMLSARAMMRYANIIGVSGSPPWDQGDPT